MGKIDLSGKKFGNWTVIKFSHKVKNKLSKVYYWDCICICGLNKKIDGHSLRMKVSTSCGKFTCRLSFRDITNKKFTKLTAKNIHHKDFWNCECDCGKKVIVRQWYLEKGNTKSCGCLRSDKKRESIMKEMYRSHLRGSSKNNKIKSRNKIKNYLSKNDYFKLIIKPCYYCGGFDKKTDKSKKYPFITNLCGVDRKNNEPYYRKVNSVSCCSVCNYMKYIHKLKDFHSHIKKIYNNISK